jgi:hypothetical protein
MQIGFGYNALNAWIGTADAGEQSIPAPGRSRVAEMGQMASMAVPMQDSFESTASFDLARPPSGRAAARRQ